MDNSVTINRDINFHAIEEAVLSLPQVKIETKHLFAPNQYARTIAVPANTVITGAKHLVDHLTIVSKGKIRIYDDQGNAVKDLKAGDVFVTKAGAQRAGLAIEDTTWTDIFSTPETSIEKLEATLVENYHGQLQNEELKWLS